MLGDNDYGARVYIDDVDDVGAPTILRALHAELCHHGEHQKAFPACYRALAVVNRYLADVKAGHVHPGATALDQLLEECDPI